jgi:hypothetical protein
MGIDHRSKNGYRFLSQLPQSLSRWPFLQVCSPPIASPAPIAPIVLADMRSEHPITPQG